MQNSDRNIAIEYTMKYNGGEGMEKGEIKMPTKLLDREETLAANSLRSLSQKSLVEMVTNFEKLGVIVNNDILIAMLSWDKYEKLVDLINDQSDKITELESLIEDIQLSQLYGKDVLKAENKESASYEFNSAEDLFNMLDK